MKKLIYIVLIVFSTFSSKAQTPKEIGLNFINYLFQNNYSEAINLLDNKMKSLATPAMIDKAIQSIQQQYGQYLGNLDINSEKEDGYSVLYYYSMFTNQKVDIKISFDSLNKIAGFYFTYHKDFNQQNDKRLNENSNYTILSDCIKLPGTLMVPLNDNKKILAIFIHGSGPQDRNESVNGNTPFKDIAEGLYEKGIASYRFDKRTKVAPQTFINNNYTIEQETVQDIINIVKAFKDSDSFKNYKIVLIGHSLGAMLLPKIINDLKDSVCCAIMLAGNARPLSEVVLDQYAYLYSLYPTDEMKTEMTNIKIKVDYLNGKQFTLQSPSDSLPFNLPASYWMSLRNYHPLIVIQQVNTPLLIIQGGNDYQVTIKDFDLWKQSEIGKATTTFKFYPKLTHLFFETNSKPSPKDYESSHTVPNYFIDDIVHWILNISTK